MRGFDFDWWLIGIYHKISSVEDTLIMLMKGFIVLSNFEDIIYDMVEQC